MATERSRVLASAVAGACLGALGGYLFFTERGRALRDRFEPVMDGLRDDVRRVRRALQDVGEMALEGVAIVQDVQSRAASRAGGASH